MDYGESPSNDEEDDNAPQRPRSSPQNLDVRSYHQASQQKYGDRRVGSPTPSEQDKTNDEAASTALEDGEMEDKAPPPQQQTTSPPRVEVHNGEPDSDCEIVAPRAVGTHSLPHMPGPERWPKEHTRDNMLARAIVSPQDYYQCFVDWKRQSKSIYGGGVHPIPVVLYANETPEEYERALVTAIRISPVLTTERSQRLKLR